MAENSSSHDHAYCSKPIPSNEEIVEEVIKGLDRSCIGDSAEVSTKNDSEEKIKVQTEGVKEKCSNGDIHPERNQSNLPEDLNNSDDEGKEEGDSDDVIDELSMKDMEESLSQEEKERFRQEAEKMKLEGNNFFKSGQYRDSAKSYTQGLRTCPLAFPKDRAIMYSNRAAAKMKLGLKPTAIEDCSKAIELDPLYVKAWSRRAQLHEETEKLDEALSDYQEIVKLDPSHQDAQYAIRRLPQMINERNEKMKADMFAKLKDLGNMILRPFNLSTDNFQLNQDPNSGGYSINFKPNTPR